MAYNQGKETEWNAAMLQSMRLDKEFHITNEYFSMYHLQYNPGMVKTLQAHVFNIYDEVEPKMNKVELGKARKYIEKINQIKNITGIQKTQDGEHKSTVNIEKYEKKIHRLRAFRRFVIAVADRAGMMNPNKKGGPVGTRGF